MRSSAQGCRAATAAPAGCGPGPGRPSSRQRIPPRRDRAGSCTTATMSRTFSTKSGSSDSLKVSSCHGLRPNAFQIRLTVGWDIPKDAGQSPGRPVRGVVRLLGQGLHDHRLHVLVGDLCGTPERCSSRGLSAVWPRTGTATSHRRRRTSQLGRHHLVGFAFSAGQHDLRSQRQTLRARRAPSPTGQRRPALRHRVSGQLSVDRFEPCAPPSSHDPNAPAAPNSRSTNFLQESQNRDTRDPG